MPSLLQPVVQYHTDLQKYNHQKILHLPVLVWVVRFAQQCRNIPHVYRQVTSVEIMMRTTIDALVADSSQVDDAMLEHVIFSNLEATSKEERLICLDNMEDVFEKHKSEVKEFFCRVFDLNSNTVKWLVTSRLPYTEPDDSHHGLPPMAHYQIGGMQEADSRIFLQRFSKPVNLSQEDIACYLQMSGRVPLAMKLLTSAVKTPLPEHIRTREYIARMVKEGASGSIKYAFQTLSQTDQRSLVSLSVLQTANFDIECVIDVLRIPSEQASSTMMVLTHRQIVQRHMPGEISGDDKRNSTSIYGYYYSFHPLVLYYLTQTYKDHTHLVSNARACLCEHILRKVNAYIHKRDTSYREAVFETVCSHRTLFKTLFDLFDLDDFDIVKIGISVDGLEYLQKVLDVLVYSPVEKARRYDKLATKYQDSDKSYFYLFCNKERVANLMTAGNTDEAIKLVEDTLNSEHITRCNAQERSESLVGLLYEKGRALRAVPRPCFKTIMECFDKALDLVSNQNGGSTKTMNLALLYNAKGNAFHDQRNVNESYRFHDLATKAATTCTPDGYHPFVSVFEFNMGTVSFAKAERTDKRDPARMVLYEEALARFNTVMQRDRLTGNDRLPTFADKLSHRSLTLIGLQCFEEALRDRNEQIDILECIYEQPHTKIADAYTRKGDLLVKWRKQMDYGTDKSRKLLVSILSCYQKVEYSITDGHPLSTPQLKNAYLLQYRAIVERDVPKEQRQSIIRFCQKYEAGESFDSSSDSSSVDSSDSSSSSSSSSPDEATHSDYMSDPNADEDGHDTSLDHTSQGQHTSTGNGRLSLGYSSDNQNSSENARLSLGYSSDKQNPTEHGRFSLGYISDECNSETPKNIHNDLTANQDAICLGMKTSLALNAPQHGQGLNCGVQSLKRKRTDSSSSGEML